MQPSYEDLRKPPTNTMYPTVPQMPISHGPVMMPATSHMPALVPVTHISNRGSRIDQRADSYDADLELAKKLQAEFDADSKPSTSSTSSSSSQSSQYSQPKPQPVAQPAKSSSGQQECPICGHRVTLADLEAHVEQHFEDEEAKKAPAKPGEKTISKTEAKAGFFAKFFGKEEEKKAAPNT